MDEWRSRVATDLLGHRPAPTPATFAPDAGAALEIAQGHARAEVAYLLGLGRTSQLPITGNVLGDDVWVQLGTQKVRFHLDRARHAVAVECTAREPAVIGYDDAARALSGPKGDGEEYFDMRAFVRRTLDGAIAAWKANPVPLPPPAWQDPPPRGRIHGAEAAAAYGPPPGDRPLEVQAYLEPRAGAKIDDEK